MDSFEEWWLFYTGSKLSDSKERFSLLEISIARDAFAAGLKVGAQEEAEASGASRKTNFDGDHGVTNGL